MPPRYRIPYCIVSAITASASLVGYFTDKKSAVHSVAFFIAMAGLVIGSAIFVAGFRGFMERFDVRH